MASYLRYMKTRIEDDYPAFNSLTVAGRQMVGMNDFPKKLAEAEEAAMLEQVPFATITAAQQLDMNAAVVPVDLSAYYSDSECEESGEVSEEVEEVQVAPVRRAVRGGGRSRGGRSRGGSRQQTTSRRKVNQRPAVSHAPVTLKTIPEYSHDSDAENNANSEDSSDKAATDDSSDESESEAESKASPPTASHSAQTSLSRGHAAREERLDDIVNTPKQVVQIRKGNKRAREDSDDEYEQEYDVSGRDKAAGSSRPPAKRGKKDQSLPTKNQIRKHASSREWVEMPGLPTILKYDGYYPCPVKTCNHGYKPVKGSVQVHFRLYHENVLPKAGGRSADNDKMDCIFRSEMEPCKPYKLEEYGRHMLYWHWKPMTHQCKTCGNEFYARETADVRNHVSACEQRRTQVSNPKDRKGKGRA